MEKVIWYKVLDKDLKAKDGGDFDYSKFVQSKDWTPKIDTLSLCNSGYHVTKYWNMFLSDTSNKIFEVEVKGLIEEEVLAGVCEKAVCSSLKIVKEFIPVYKNNLNTGYSNTGYSNTGYSNTGNRNTGDRNTGDSNTGDKNTGYRNIGNWNTGDSNTGNWNTGDSNTGNRNTGNWNTGDNNTGDSNTGNRNTGDKNTGYRNTGNWNTANRHVGSFNSKPPEKVYLFNKEILFTEYEKISFPNWLFFDLEKDYKKFFKKAFGLASIEQIKATIALPNFDYQVFEEISGITKTMFNKKVGVKKT